jgi:hypothetical protein
MYCYDVNRTKVPMQSQLLEFLKAFRLIFVAHGTQRGRAAVACREAPLQDGPHRDARREVLVRQEVKSHEDVQQRQHDGSEEDLLVDVDARGARAAQQVERGLENCLRNGAERQVRLRPELGVRMQRVNGGAEAQVGADFVEQVEQVQYDDVNKSDGEREWDERVFPQRDGAQRQRVSGIGEVVEGNPLEARLQVEGGD